MNLPIRQFAVVGVLLALVHLAWQPAALARAMPMTLKEKVAASAVIARVEITGTRSSRSKGRYRSVATARVVTLIKGAAPGGTVTFDFDNGLGCPNVLYKAGEACLVFLGRQKNGRLETVNTYYGKFSLDGDTVKRWYSVRFHSRDTAFDEVETEIRKLVPARASAVRLPLRAGAKR